MFKMFFLAVLPFLLLGCNGGSDDNKNGSTSDEIVQNPVEDADTGDSNELPVALQAALNDGDISSLSVEDAPMVLEAMLASANQTIESNTSLLSDVLGNGAPSQYLIWRRSVLIEPMGAQGATPLIMGDDGNTLATIQGHDGVRAVAFGGNFLAPDNDSNYTYLDTYQADFKRVLSWLVSGDANTAIPNQLNIAYDLSSGWVCQSEFKDCVEAPFEHIGIDVTQSQCSVLGGTDEENLACAQQSDLVLLSAVDKEVGDLQSQVSALLQSGVPILYLHNHGEFLPEEGAKILAAMGMEYATTGASNYFKQDQYTGGRSATENIELLSNPFRDYLPFLMALHEGTLNTSYDWSSCVNSAGTFKCPDVPNLDVTLVEPVDALRDVFDGYTKAGTPLFSAPGNEFYRLANIWADLNRRTMTYPMFKEEDMADYRFQKAYVSDAMVTYLRRVGEAQPDMGTFTLTDQTQLPVSPQQETVTVTLPEDSGFTALERYIKPGTTATIELVDAGSASVSVYVNTTPAGGTRVWNPKEGSGIVGYARPRFLQSPNIPLNPAEPVEVNSPYGGTLEVRFNGAEAGQTVTFKVTNVGAQPVLNLRENADVNAFVNELTQTPFEWAEIKLDGVEIHTRVDQMLSVVNNGVYAGDLTKYLNELDNYFIGGAYHMAGFAGTKPLSAAVLAECNRFGWDCENAELHQLPDVQHITAGNTAACGAGCSGNPYSQAQGVDPRGFLESHELGHNLQYQEFRVDGGISGEVSNNIFPLQKNGRLYQDFGVDLGSNKVDYEATFNMLVAGLQNGNSSDKLNQDLWTDATYAVQGNKRLAFYTQWALYWADKQNSSDAQTPWEIYTLLYLHAREFLAADVDNSTQETADDWDNVKGKLGFSTYATRPDRDSSRNSQYGNDYLLITLSKLTGHDQRNVFDMWGIKYSSAATQQLDTFGLPVEPLFFYTTTPMNDYSVGHLIDMSSDPSTLEYATE
ncbi:ImpA family metalloprotease [Vibrio sp. ABG19]|uniref:ImpA family metalloprotease n=1 Tax=Vibrio sp. ABG19 TaxID=2817385 RepID=UPI00249F9380|nr:ImpA family metalloprotease [Vibrio sp. ABG19]WGY44785.1 ImpA family metalloprotease [Vibrio sp. ABG19]